MKTRGGKNQTYAHGRPERRAVRFTISSAWEHTEWEYSCHLNEDDNTLVSLPFGIRTEYVYDDNGEQVSAREAYSDGCASFSLDAEGCLIWKDEKENAGEGMRFEKIADEPTITGSIEDGSHISRVGACAALPFKA